MSDTYTIPEEPDDDALAAEFALALLEPEEMQRLARRVEDDPAFAAMVSAWQARLSGLDAEFAEAMPPPRIKAAIDGRLFGTEEVAAPRSGLWRNLWAWRALAACALAALALVLIFERGFERPAAPMLAAALTGDAGLSFVAVYDPATRDLRIRQTGGTAPSDRELELWLIAGSDPPQSLGVLGADLAVPAVAEPLATQVADGATLAVSLEPPGGSPTGLPTGPVVAAGPVGNI